MSTNIDTFDKYNTRRVAYVNLVLNNKTPEIMINDKLRLDIMFLGGAKKGFPCSGLKKPNLMKTLGKGLQSNNENLPLIPQQPTHMERKVVTKYKAEHMRIEQEQ